MDKFLAGFTRNAGNTAEIYYLSNKDTRKKVPDLFKRSEVVILAFPLYSDCTPGIVKEFIESLAPLKNKAHKTKLGFFVQSGFPEGIHTACVEQYLEKLARRLGCPYIGTIRKGGVEGIQHKSERSNRTLYLDFESLGEKFGKTGAIDPLITERLKKPERFPRAMYPLFLLMMKIGLVDMGWNRQLKANNAFGKRYDRPYL